MGPIVEILFEDGKRLLGALCDIAVYGIFRGRVAEGEFVMVEGQEGQNINIVSNRSTRRATGIIVAAAVVLMVIVVVAVAFALPEKGESRELEDALSLGEKYLSELNYEQAIASYRAAIEIDPKCTDAYLGLVDTYLAMGKPEEALWVLEEAETVILANGADEKTEEALRRIREKMEEIKRLMEPESKLTTIPKPTVTPEPTPIPTEEPETNAIEIRFDGLYCHMFDKDGYDGINSYNSVFRFYNDDTVIGASIGRSKPTGGYFPHANWFDRNGDRFKDYLGHYNISGSKITFTIISEMGTVDYQGYIDGKYMILDSHSNINGHEFENVQYEFYSFNEIPEWND